MWDGDGSTEPSAECDTGTVTASSPLPINAAFLLITCEFAIETDFRLFCMLSKVLQMEFFPSFSQAESIPYFLLFSLSLKAYLQASPLPDPGAIWKHSTMLSSPSSC